MTVSYPTGSHWFYAIVSMSSKSIVVVDSWREVPEGHRWMVANIIKNFLKDEYNHHHTTTTFDENAWNIFHENEVTYQTDKNSCGVYTILYALKAMKENNHDYSSFTWKTTGDIERKTITKIRKAIKDVVVGNKSVRVWLQELVDLGIGF
jgi:Ulp1 family protease